MNTYLAVALQNKYVINIDGTVAAYRLPFLMLGDSLIMKQESEYYEHFYKDMKPFEHYIPIKHDLSDLIEKIKWAKENDKEVTFIQYVVAVVSSIFEIWRYGGTLWKAIRQVYLLCFWEKHLSGDFPSQSGGQVAGIPCQFIMALRSFCRDGTIK